SLSADLAHGPGGLPEPGLRDVVLQLLAPDRVPDHLLDFFIVRTASQRFAQVGFVQAEKTGAELPLGREADPVAVGAEGLGNRVDEADLALAVAEAVDLRRRVRRAPKRLERVDRIDHAPDLAAGEHPVFGPGVVGIERHELDEANLIRLSPGEL